MAEHDAEDRSMLQRVSDKIQDAVTDPALERGLTNQAAAMPGAAGDLNYAAGASPSTGPAGGISSGTGAAAAGSLTDQEPVGKADAEE